jgi:hypothetical protein
MRPGEDEVAIIRHPWNSDRAPGGLGWLFGWNQTTTTLLGYNHNHATTAFSHVLKITLNRTKL